MIIEVAAGAAALAATAFGIRWYRKARNAWRVIEEGVCTRFHHDEWELVVGADPYTYEDQVKQMVDTVITFAHGATVRIAGRLERAGNGAHLKVLRNRLGEYKLE